MTTMFEREDWTLFRSFETISQKAGVPLRLLARLVAKELADNALDTGAACTVNVNDGGALVYPVLVVEDDGAGIPGGEDAAAMARLFSIRRPLTSSKMLRLPSRGALGNGLRVVVGAVLASGGHLMVETRGKRHTLTPRHDGGTDVETRDWPLRSQGTRIEVHPGRGLSFDESSLTWAKLACAFAPNGTGYKGKTSPHWYSGDAFHEMCLAAGQRPLRDLVTVFHGMDIRAAGQLVLADLPANEITRTYALELLESLRGASASIKPEALGKLTKDALGSRWGYHRIAGHIKVGNDAALPAQVPFVIEAFIQPKEEDLGISDDDHIEVLVNRTPITGEVSVRRAGKKNQIALFGCGLRHLFDVGRNPVTVMLSVITPYMPITTDGKEPDLQRYVGDITTALETAAKRAKRLRPAGEPAVSQKQVIVYRLDEAVDKASGSGTYRYSLRQLYYAVRPHLLDSHGKEPGYDYFAKVITDYEAEFGDLPGLYRDPRGVLYHPHTGEEIPLGTLAVERYQRPDWTFNKVLYSEKEGFFSILRDVKWPERNDCALLTSKGFASRAARDVIDLIGDSQEEIYFFCIHDADASGTMIYQALQEATRARRRRKVHIINLGLEPSEALGMDLQVETFREEVKRQLPVAEYVPSRWRDWLQTQRIELNAMTTPQFLSWLDAKMAGYAGKVMPPTPVLRQTMEVETRKAVEGELARRILDEADFAGQVEQAMRQLAPQIDAADLGQVVVDGLGADPTSRWSAPLAQQAARLARNGL